MNQNETKKTGGILGINKATKLGSWTMAMTLILLAVLIVINLLVGALPRSITRLDTTPNHRYTLSATSEKFLRGIDRDVNLVVIAAQGAITPTMENFLGRYTACNSRIKVKVIDPLANPAALENYSEIVSTGRYIVVESDLRYYTVDTLELESVYVEDLQQSMPLYQYEQYVADQSLVEAYYQYYGVDLTNATRYFDGEQKITSAIEYVTCENLPHLYLLTGNNGNELSTMLNTMLDQVLLECDALELQPGDAVPEDASCVIINAPAFDLAASAADALVAFAEQGGNIIMMTTPENAEMPNLMRVAAAFGVRGTSGGMLHEGNANKYVGASTVLKPTVNTEHLLTYTVYANDMHMVMPKAHGILRDAALPEGVTVTDLFNATDAYTVAADGKESDLGAVATGVIAENANTGAKLLWFASADAFSDTTLSAYGNGAAYYFAIGADMLNDKYTSTLTAIEGINVEETSLVVSELSFRVLGVLISLVIPIVLIGCGVVVWIRRRRR